MDEKTNVKHEARTVTVVAGSSLPRGAYFGPVPEIDIRAMEQTNGSAEHTVEVQVVAVEGTLTARDGTTDWLYGLRAARDVHEQTLELYRSHENLVFVRTTRDVAMGERLFVWFEEAFGREKNVPYLVLSNIRGSQHYQCTRCSKVFTFPNLLKLHLMDGCDVMSPRATRTRYQETPHLSDTFHSIKRTYVDYELSIPKPEKTESYITQRNANVYSVKRKVLENPYPLASFNCQVSYGSDKNMFIPYTLEARLAIVPRQPREARLFDKNSSSLTGNITGREACLFDKNSGSFSDNTTRGEACLFDRNSSSLTGHTTSGGDSDNSKNPMIGCDNEEEPLDILHQSFIEFSTKSGHRCIYCGKFYSRKYGLKIHLRTHTGYKPLKCKICLRAFGDPSNLNKHIRLHSEGTTPYKCAYCGKILVRRRDLLRHLNSRHPGHTGHMTKMEVIT